MNIEFKPTKKQHECWKALEDKKINHILYGGSAGSGKSYLIANYLLINAIRYPRTRWAMCRARLTSLKRTTLKTLIDLCNEYNFTDYKINYQSNTIYFGNGSEILMIDLFQQPSDPEFVRLGSLELTGAVIDELAEISKMAFTIITSRIRYRLNEYNLTPKVLCASNPVNSWVKTYFVTPYYDNNLPDNIAFIPALPSDNVYLDTNYLQLLNRTLDYNLKQRLLHGDWSFSQSDNDLFDYQSFTDCFKNPIFIQNIKDEMYLTADIAELGKDKTVISIWHGLRCILINKFEKKDSVEITNIIRDFQIKYKIKNSNVISDSTGVGAAIAANIKGSVRYMPASASISKSFKNIKSEMMFKFAEMINNLNINFDIDFDDELVQEALLYKKDYSSEIAKISSKDTIKQALGRSPDTIDSLYLRMYFLLKPTSFTTKIRVV